MQEYLLDRQRLTLCRERLGITKIEAARRMQLSQPAYVRYETGTRIPSIHTIQTMANVLGTSVDYLTGKSDQFRPDSYLIKEAIEPELFYLVDCYKKSDSNIQTRLIEYMKELCN